MGHTTAANGRPDQGRVSEGLWRLPAPDIYIFRWRAGFLEFLACWHSGERILLVSLASGPSQIPNKNKWKQ